MKAKIAICLDSSVFYAVEEKRGLAPRSAYINDVLKKSLGMVVVK